MSDPDRRPPVSVAHVVLPNHRMEESARFMRTVGMRAIFNGPQVSDYEMRGGTHLILMLKESVVAGDASFDFMVDDLHATHQQFASLELALSQIEARPVIDHEIFTAGSQLAMSSHFSQATLPEIQLESEFYIAHLTP